ncbi:MAG: iron-containing redox enzyme family protein [Bacteriovoracia bacterium]
MKLQSIVDESLKTYQLKYGTKMFKDKESYGNWLAQTYYFVRHSTSLLGYAMPHLHNEELRHHFEHHLAEEKRHDLMILKDLERMGKKIEDYEELHLTQAFYQSQYYRIAFEGGTSLLGYILLLEGLAVCWGRNVYEEIKDQYKGSTLFLKVHAEEDPHHLEAAIQTILKLPEKDQKAVLRNFNYSHEIYSSLIEEISHKKSLRIAA